MATGACGSCAPRRRSMPQCLNASRLELGVQLLFHRDALDGGVHRQAILVRRIVLALDERLQVVAALLRDAETILGDEIARQLLLDIRDVVERDTAYHPF